MEVVFLQLLQGFLVEYSIEIHVVSRWIHQRALQNTLSIFHRNLRPFIVGFCIITEVLVVPSLCLLTCCFNFLDSPRPCNCSTFLMTYFKNTSFWLDPPSSICVDLLMLMFPAPLVILVLQLQPKPEIRMQCAAQRWWEFHQYQSYAPSRGDDLVISDNEDNSCNLEHILK